MDIADEDGGQGSSFIVRFHTGSQAIDFVSTIVGSITAQKSPDQSISKLIHSR
jgi:hypothetical protein